MLFLSNCKKKERINCDYLKCCKITNLKFNFHNKIITEKNMKNLKLENYSIIINDFEMIKKKNCIQVLEYVAIKVDSIDNRF
jgi:hypothetical protein